MSTCFGKGYDGVGILYLHGVDPKKPSSQELSIRDTLRKLSDELKVTIAVMRSDKSCTTKPGHLCWQHNPATGLAKTYKAVMGEARTCLGTKKSGVIGFSNGGYLASKAAHSCLTPAAAWVIAIGSAGQAPPQKKPHDHCPPLHLLNGRKDLTHQKAKRYVDALKKNGYSAWFHQFDGGHDVPYAPLKELLKQLLRPAPHHVSPPHSGKTSPPSK